MGDAAAGCDDCARGASRRLHLAQAAFRTDTWAVRWLPAMGVAILLSVSWMGTVADGPLLERYLDIMLFVAITGIIIFGIPFIQTLVVAFAALTIYLAFLLGVGEEDTRTALSGFFFFVSGLSATVLARRTMKYPCAEIVPARIA